ncbi:MAG: L-serine ammonia-lyase, iron-sulfur-dependent, subunit alpha [Muribaculaceae bacterium]|nr:L-serine ammonia-lyase, iron-sulfur-dependent, subunit alpha [Muribaculaceae bacterium]
MDSIRQIFKIGKGPSSSHTMGPRRAAIKFAEANPSAARYEVTLFGSLAATGKGHLTDTAILDVLRPIAPTEIIWRPETVLPFHTNGMTFKAFDANGTETDSWTAYSIGGGDIVEEGQERRPVQQLYHKTRIKDILNWCTETGHSYWEYVDMCEGEDIWNYLREVWHVMKAAVESGIEEEGVLPGGLGVRRKAYSYYMHAGGHNGSLKSRGLVYAYALAVSEENAGGGTIVTAPTCGSCGVLPAVLYHLFTSKNFSERHILRALATAGLFGNVVKYNASVSGAEVGCQGEIGVACAMAAAASSQLFGGTPAQIEYSAEMGLEHHLGLTCDPVCGLVQIPCIERNAYAAARALDANLYAAFSDGRHAVDFDRIVEVMKQTGHDIPSLYKETSQGGLAVIR